jgi:hypothetical protein
MGVPPSPRPSAGASVSARLAWEHASAQATASGAVSGAAFCRSGFELARKRLLKAWGVEGTWFQNTNLSGDPERTTAV